MISRIFCTHYILPFHRQFIFLHDVTIYEGRLTSINQSEKGSTTPTKTLTKQQPKQTRELKEQAAIIAEKDSALAERDSALAEKDSALAEQAALIASLKAQLESQNT